jgi:hypothetical protein
MKNSLGDKCPAPAETTGTMQTRFLEYIYFGLTVATLLIGRSPKVEAQYWLEDRARAEGRGFRLGDLELHPGVGAEMGYDTNVFYRAENPEDSAILRISPHLFLSTLGAERRNLNEEGERRTPPALTFRGGFFGSYYHYFSTENKDNLSASVDLHLNINPERPFSVSLDGTYTRSVMPFVDYYDRNVPNYARDDVGVGPKLVFSTKSGLLSGAVGYKLGAGFYEDDGLKYNNSITHNVSLDGHWQFYPRTALIYDGNFAIQKYTKWKPSSPALLNDNRRISSRLGINGALTTRVALTLRAGYTAGFFDGSYEDYDGVIGQAELRWTPVEAFNWKLGYERSYTSSFQGNYGRQDRVYTNASLMVGRVFLMDAEVWAGFLHYGVPRTGSGDALGADGEENRKDTRISASLGAEYRFISWLGLNAKVGYSTNITDFETNITTANLRTSIEPAKFNKIEAWLGVRAFY